MKRKRPSRRLPVRAAFLLVMVALAVSYLFLQVREQEALRADAAFESQAASIETAFQRLAEEPPLPGSIKIPIFIYHSVRPHYAGESLAQDAYDITPELLEKQLQYLKDNGYTPITMDDLAMYLTEGNTGPVKKPVVLSFDDGWQNQYTYAFPLLKKYGMRAVFYVYTDPIDKQPHYLTWNELKEMDAAGMQIASHTLSHPYLHTLTDAQLQKELTQSKKILEEHLGKPVVHFASPFGYSDARIEAAVKAAGYETARTTYRSVYQSKGKLLHLTAYLVSDNMQDFIDVLNR